MASGQNHKLCYASHRWEMEICDILYFNPKSEQIFMRPQLKKKKKLSFSPWFMHPAKYHSLAATLQLSQEKGKSEEGGGGAF